MLKKLNSSVESQNEAYEKIKKAVEATVPSDLTTPQRHRIALVLRKIAAEYDTPVKSPMKPRGTRARSFLTGRTSRTSQEFQAANGESKMGGEDNDGLDNVDARISVDGSFVDHEQVERNPYAKKQANDLGFCMADPQAPHRMTWDFVVIMPCLAYLTMMMPFRMAFNNEATGVMWTIETTMDFVFLIDIVINFRTAFIDGATGDLITDPWEVAKHYFKSWFVLDFVSGIPFGILELDSLRELSALKVLKGGRVLKAFKLLRFLKVSRLIKGTKLLGALNAEFVDRIEDFLADGTTKTYARMLRIVVAMGIICHFMTCLWVLAGRDSDLAGDDSWLRNDFEAYSSEDTERGPKVQGIYIAAYYFCFTTMTTVGYGDVVPYSSTERLIAIVLQICGGFSMAWVIASLTSIVTSEDANAQQAAARLDAVGSYVNKMGVPTDLGRRIRRHFRHFYENKSSLDETTILMEMSTALRSELTDFLVQGGPLSKVPLFKSMSPVYWARVLPLLRPCMFARDELVCRQGEECVEGFLVVDGCLTGATSTEPSHDMRELAKQCLKTLPLSFRRAAACVGGKPVDILEDEPDMHAGTAADAAACSANAGALSAHRGGLASESGDAAGDNMVHATPLEVEALHRISQFHARVSHMVHAGSSNVTSLDAADAETTGALARGSREGLPSVTASAYLADVEARLHLRVLVPGGMVNVLSLLKVWERCVETVQASEKTDCYALNADAFFAVFKDDERALLKMCDHVCATQFKMQRRASVVISQVEVPSPTALGAPLYVLSDEGVAAAEAKFALQLSRQHKVAARARARASTQAMTSAQRHGWDSTAVRSSGDLPKGGAGGSRKAPSSTQ